MPSLQDLEDEFLTAMRRYVGSFIARAGASPSAGPCSTILFRLEEQLNTVGVPVSEVGAWRQQLNSCYEAGKITAAEYRTALRELESGGVRAHPPA
jgi:hypothetical protein